MNNNIDDLVLFIPEHQDEFWKSVNPDVRNFLDSYETKEDWTYKYDELPELFNNLSSHLPGFSESPISEESIKVLDHLYPILASLPLRHGVSAIAWLDRHSESPDDIGWGMVIYYGVSEIVHSDKEHKNYLYAKVIYDRINLMLKTKLASELFCNLNDLDSF